MPIAPLAYVMKGVINTPPYQDVTWKVYGTPDLTGAQSGYTNLINILVDYIIEDELAGSQALQLEEQVFLTGDAFGPSNNNTITMVGDVSGRSSANTVAKLQGRTMSSAAPSVDDIIKWTGTQWAPSSVTTQAASGDLTGNYPNPTVVALRGMILSTSLTSASNNDVLTWNSGTSRWEAKQLSTQVTFAADLSGNLTTQYVKAISGNNGGGGTVDVNTNKLAASTNLAIDIAGSHIFTLTNDNVAYLTFQSSILTIAASAGLNINTGATSSTFDGNVRLHDNLIVDDQVTLGNAGTNQITLNSTGSGNAINITAGVASSNVYVSAVGGSIILDSPILSLPNTTTAGTASSGGATLPGNPVGFLVVTIGGTARKIPYYAT